MSSSLRDLREGAWPLDEFVDQANALLPDLLPKDAGRRAAEPVNQRLVRHYATQRLVDEPLKEGREARYLYRHLLQVLVVRRLLAEGFTAAVVGQVLEGRSDTDLEGLLTGGLRIELVPQRGPADERAEFLRQVRARAGLDSSAGPPMPQSAAGPRLNFDAPAAAGPAREAPRRSTPAPDAARAAAQPGMSPVSVFNERTWSHVALLDGLELLIRDDFKMPDTRTGDAELLQLLRVALLYLEQKRRGKP